MSENKFVCEYAKRGQASCKKCKQKLEKGALRLGKLVPNPFGGEAAEMKQWYHVACLFETFAKVRPTTKKIEDMEDIDGVDELKVEDRAVIEKHISELLTNQKSPPTKKVLVKKMIQTTLAAATPSPKKSHGTTASSSKVFDEVSGLDAPSSAGTSSDTTSDSTILSFAEPDTDPAVIAQDDAFRTLRKVCAELADESSYLGKQRILSEFVAKGTSGQGFKGDLFLLIKLLLPGFIKRVYNIKDRQLVKLFAAIFEQNVSEMIADLDQGDSPETIRSFFVKSSSHVQPAKRSELSNQDVDHFLDELTKVSREEDKQRLLSSIAARCTANDLKMLVRLIKHDLRINTGAKHILEALDPRAYDAFQSSRNLYEVLRRVVKKKRGGLTKQLSVRASLMTPVLPMLAEACKSVAMALRKCPQGFYSEIKYDGERLQLHKSGTHFDFFSRSLKPVQPHKTQFLKEYIPLAFPKGQQLIIDGELLLVDNKSGNPLPFGTLGVHKKEAFKDASVCLFVFDILHLNDENLMAKPLKLRRQLLQENMVELKNHVMFSEIQFMDKAEPLQTLLNRVFRQGLEGLVLKDINGVYEPGKRHWLKVKKDYLADGAMADSADLVVVGAYYGTGNKGGMMSVFLMGTYDAKRKRWCTVTKVGNGHDDKTLARLQTELKMKKISKDPQKVPAWLDCERGMTPDFVAVDPCSAPVWEITGAEFSKTTRHTAQGISIRFPRVTKIRSDKTWREATDLERLVQLFTKSKEHTDLNVGVDAAAAKIGAKRRLSDPDNDDPVEKEDGEEELVASPPLKRCRIENTKPSCRYGTKCYQTNPQHLSTFSHKNEPIQPRVLRNLPNVFTGIVFSPALDAQFTKDELDNMERYIVALDGDFERDAELAREPVTHVLVREMIENDTAQQAHHVSCGWLWRCVLQRKLVPLDKEHSRRLGEAERQQLNLLP